MKSIKINTGLLFLVFFGLGNLVSCSSAKKSSGMDVQNFIKNNFSNATSMLNNMLKTADEKFSVKNGAYPRTTTKKAK